MHEALNFAGVWQAPVVFLVQNNGYAISVPLAKQTAAPALAYRGVGYGVRSMLIDGNDAAAVFATVRAALGRASAGRGPTLIEAVTYRVEAHTNADDAARYRSAAEVEGGWPAIRSGGSRPTCATAGYSTTPPWPGSARPPSNGRPRCARP